MQPDFLHPQERGLAARRLVNTLSKDFYRRILMLTYVGTEKNPLELKPNYNFWAPFVGLNCRRGKMLYNSEFRKANNGDDIQSAGASPDNLSVEKLMDLFCEGKVGTSLCVKIYEANVWVG